MNDERYIVEFNGIEVDTPPRRAQYTEADVSPSGAHSTEGNASPSGAHSTEGNAPLSRAQYTECAKIRERSSNEEVGSLQIIYFTNGLKNMAYIERVFIKRAHRKKRAGRALVISAVKRISESRSLLDAHRLHEHLVSDLSTLSDEVERTRVRDIDEIFLIATAQLAPFYESCGFQNRSQGSVGECKFVIKLGAKERKSSLS